MTKFTKEQQKLLEQIIVFHGDGFSVRGSVLGHVWGRRPATSFCTLGGEVEEQKCRGQRTGANSLGG